MSKPRTAKAIVKNVLEQWDYFGGDDPAIPALWVKGSSPLFLVLGENAGGKSFFRRCISLEIRDRSGIKEVIHLSMEARTGATFMGAAKAFVYGDENSRSTGENSVNTISGAITTCRDRTHPHVLYWDEPDIGMSEGAAAGAGIAIAEFVADLPEHTKGVFITTHSRAMVEQLVDLKPHYLHLGTDPKLAPQTLQEWLEREVVPVSPDELKEASRARFRAIQKILNKVRASKRGAQV
jgi:hypothetical protein